MSGRAPQGFGSFKRTPNGFDAWISLGTDPNGKRIRRHLVAPTQDELMDKIAKLRERARIGSVLDDKLTVGAWLRHWLGIVEKRDVAPATFEKYRWAVEKHLVPALGNVTLIELTTERIEVGLERLQNDRTPNRPATASTQHAVLTVLRGALQEALRREKLSRNVARNVRIKMPEEVEIVPLTTDEVTAVFKTCENRINGVRWILALMLGLRQSETLGLWWSDIDLEAGTLRVRRQLLRQYWRHGCSNRCEPGTKGKDCPTRWRTPRFDTKTKTPAGRRELHLDEALVSLLKNHRRQQTERRLKSGHWPRDWDEQPWVFTGSSGHPVDHNNDRRDWGNIVTLAKISPTRIHDLRHTNATMLLMNNVDTRTVMSMLGWSRTAIAARYQHPVAEMQKNAATKVADFMLGRDTGAK